MPKRKQKLIEGQERGSVQFGHIGKTSFWFTPTNRIYILTPEPNGRIIFPKLRGGMVVYDDPHYKPTEDIDAWLLEKLKKQREIRSDWATPEEDEIAFTYHD